MLSMRRFIYARCHCLFHHFADAAYLRMPSRHASLMPDAAIDADTLRYYAAFFVSFMPFTFADADASMC